MSRGFEKNNFFYNRIYNSQGQATIEAVLLATILVSGFLFATQKMQEKKFLENFATASVGRVKNMTEYGTWRESCKPISGAGGEKAANCHPNSINRSLSSAPN